MPSFRTVINLREGSYPFKVPHAIRRNREAIKNPEEARVAALEKLFHFNWMFGLDLSVKAESYQDFCGRYDELALNMLKEYVGQIPDAHNGIPRWKKFVAYRFRRCFPPVVNHSDPLDSLTAYTTPLEEGHYTENELHTLLVKGLRGKGIVSSRLEFRAIKSTKATMEYTSRDGGFNSSVEFYASGPAVVNLPPVRGDGYACLQEIASYSRRDKETYMKAFWSAYGVMKTMISLNRLPLAFVVGLDERSLKRRVPALAEGFCQILSQGISDIGKTIQGRIFPLTRGHKPKLACKPGDVILSGDYKESTSFITYEAIVVGYYHYFRYCNLSNEEFSAYMDIVKFLAGPHKFYSSKEVRSQYRSLFSKTTEVVKPKLGFDTYAYYKKHGQVSAIIGQQSSKGSVFGNFTKDYCKLPDFGWVILQLQQFWLTCRFIISVRGMLMCYSMAAPALHLIGAIPHWKFDGIFWAITGDDNMSVHPRKCSPNGDPSKNTSVSALEKEKPKTGMHPHTDKKAVRGVKAGVLAEVPYEPDLSKGILVPQRNFPIRVLFPETYTDWHAISMPEAAIRNFTEIEDKAVKDRIVSYILWLFRDIYASIEELGITIGGPNGLFPMLPPTPGAVNDKDGCSAGEIFKVPSLAGESCPRQVAVSFLARNKVSIPIEELTPLEGRMVTKTVRNLDEVVDSLRPYLPTSPYGRVEGLPVSPPLLVALRKNLLNLTPRLRGRSRCAIGHEGEVSQFEIPNPPRWIEEIFEANDLTEDFDPALAQGDCSTTKTEHDLEPIVDGDPYQPEIRDGEIVCQIHLLTSMADRNKASECALPGPYFSMVDSVVTSFDVTPVLGHSIRSLSMKPQHWFLDMANLFPRRFRECHDIAPVHHYVDAVFGKGCGEYQSQCVIWFVMERPGRAIAHHSRDFPRWTFVRAHPRISGHAGADLEFRQLCSKIRAFNPNAEIFYTSDDYKDWRVFARKIGARYRLKPVRVSSQ